MDRKHNKQIIHIARVLRKNMTRQEKRLWYDFLRNYPVRFTRQKVLGNYIADFYCASAKLVIELDGSQHYTDKGMKNDIKRTDYLSQYNIEVVRILNRDIDLNFNGVCEYIDSCVKQSLSQRC